MERWGKGRVMCASPCAPNPRPTELCYLATQCCCTAVSNLTPPGLIHLQSLNQATKAAEQWNTACPQPAPHLGCAQVQHEERLRLVAVAGIRLIHRLQAFLQPRCGGHGEERCWVRALGWPRAMSAGAISMGCAAQARCAPTVAQAYGRALKRAGVLRLQARQAQARVLQGTALHRHSHMTVKQRRLGTALMPTSVNALVMMVCIWPRKKRALSGFCAPGRARMDSMALRSCGWEALGQQRRFGRVE